MKTKQPLLLAFVLFSICFAVRAQPSPEALLAQLPAIPKVDCAIDEEKVNAFTDKIDRVTTEISDIVESIRSNTKAKMGNIDEMSDAEREKWAMEYAARMMNQAMSQSDINRNKRLFELAEEQKSLGQTIDNIIADLGKVMKQVEQRDTIESRKLKIQMDPLEKQLCSGICSPAEVARSRAAEKQIYMLKTEYCKTMSPVMENAIAQYLTAVRKLFPVYRRLAEVQNETSKIQGIGEFVPEDLSCYTAVNDYATELSQVYKYRVGKFYE